VVTFLPASECTWVSDVRHRQKHATEPLVPELTAFEVWVGIGKLKRHKSPGFDEIPSKLIKAGVRTIRFEIHKLTNLYSD
jgi:hypothetical protein